MLKILGLGAGVQSTTEMGRMLKILSLGAGVQSSTVLLMSCVGELDRLDCAIFADPGWESKATYTFLSWLESESSRYGIPVHHVSAGTSIRDQYERTPGTRFVSLPMFTEGGGRLWRQCTKQWKIEPIHAKIRELLGLKKGERACKEPQVEYWYGISLDEADRMRDSDHTWIHNCYPLVFDIPMTRQGCLKWLREHDYPEPSRSSCVGCPFHNNAEWRAMKWNRPEEFKEAVEFERTAGAAVGQRRERAYLHRSCLPLDHVDFSTLEDRGQLNWIEECTGLCGQ